MLKRLLFWRKQKKEEELPTLPRHIENDLLQLVRMGAIGIVPSEPGTITFAFPRSKSEEEQ